MNDDIFPSLAELWWKGVALLVAAWMLARLPWVRALRPWRAAFSSSAISRSVSRTGFNAMLSALDLRSPLSSTVSR